jgi:hypothetical protein
MPPASTRTSRCVGCRRPLPRTTEFFKPRYVDDPTGLARRDLARRKRRGEKNLPSLEQRQAEYAISKPDAPLYHQPRCIECDRASHKLRTVAKAVVAKAKEAGVKVIKLAGVNTQLVVDGVPSRWLAMPTSWTVPCDSDIHKGSKCKLCDGSKKRVVKFASRAEELAAVGLAVTDTDGTVPLPTNPTKALRAAYRLLVPVDPDTGKRAGRFGALGSDRTQLIERLPTLTTKKGVPKKLASLAEFAVEHALLHAGGDEADKITDELLPRYRRRNYKFARAKWASGLMSREEADARLDAGNLIGMLKWTPLHPSGARPATIIYTWAKRELQQRTRADRPIMVAKQKDGTWSQRAISYDALSSGGNDGDDAYTPLVKKSSSSDGHGGQRRNGNPSSHEPEGESADSLKNDLRTAMASLTKTDREIVSRTFLFHEKLSVIADDLGMTKGVAAQRLSALTCVLRNRLADYR